MVLCTSDKTVTEMEDKLKNTKIQEIFRTMEYGDNFENLDKASEWIKKTAIFAYVEKSSEALNGTPVELKNCVNNKTLCTIHIPELDVIKKIISKNKSQTKWTDTKAFEKTKLLTKLAEEIEKNADIISQIEIVSRGILGKDTRNKAVPLLAQYFYYYSSFAADCDPLTWKPEGLTIGVISNENTLSNVGLILAPALAAGYNIVLQVGTKLTLAVAYILELARNVGIPEDVIRLIPSDDGELLPYLSNENVAVLTLLVDLHKEKYLGINNYNKKILILSSYKTPMIVFDDADLDSTCTSVIDAAWGYQGLLPWSVNTLLVQENILNTFLNKLKRTLRLTKIGLGNDRMVDISFPSENSFDNFNDLVTSAKLQGIEVFQAEEHTNTFTPTLFIGGKVDTNMVLGADRNQGANVVNVLAFRSVDEAVNLANNSRQGLAASVWSENIGVVNEVARKLKVCNVWVNGHGLTTPEVTFSPIKDSGVGYFGGKEGFYEYQNIKLSEACTVKDLPPKVNNAVASAINSAKKSQESWGRVSKINKGKILQKLAEFIDSNKKLLSATVNEKWLDNWSIYVCDCITNRTHESHSIMEFGFSVTSLWDPRGIIAIETPQDVEFHNIKLILGALYAGNTVILLNNCTKAQNFYKELSKKFPTGVLNVFDYSLDNVKAAAVHKELNAYFGQGVNPVFGLLLLKDSKIFTDMGSNWFFIYRKVTAAKNIWTNIGKSSTCNLSI